MTDRPGLPGAGWNPGRVPAVIAIGLAAVALAASACGGVGPASVRGPDGPPTASASRPASPSSDRPAASTPDIPGLPDAGGNRTGSASPTASPAARPLAGKIIGIDPGHNGGNFTDPGAIVHQIWNGTGWESCDTTGTTTDSGYTEAQFTFNVARYLRADLRRDGARVVMTRTGNDGVGPCVDRRSEIINHARANVAVDIHADGGPASGRGFTILEPVADGPDANVIAASQRFGGDVRQAMLADTTMPVSDYTGVDGIMPRDDLAGLNLTTVPKVLIECGNMRNATDAGLLVTARFQQQVASALTAAIVRFLG
jgi:N-acetylmuramoyl-L-alanine amidase